MRVTLPADNHTFLYKLIVFENRVLRRIFVPKKEEMGWRK
jgi:hypothetical protein